MKSTADAGYSFKVLPSFTPAKTIRPFTVKNNRQNRRHSYQWARAYGGIKTVSVRARLGFAPQGLNVISNLDEKILTLLAAGENVVRLQDLRDNV